MPGKMDTPTKTTQVPTSEVLTSTIKETSMPSPGPTPTTSEVEGVLTESSQAPPKDEDWSIPCRGQDTSVCQGQPRDDLDHSFTISRNSTLNLAQMPGKLDTPTETTQVPTSEVLTSTIKETSMPTPSPTPTPTTSEVEDDLDHSFTISRNSTLNLAQMPGKLDTPTETTQVPTSEVLTSTIKETSMPTPSPTPTPTTSEVEDDLDHSFTISRNSTLNLAQMPGKLDTPTKTTQVQTSKVLTSTIKETSMPTPSPTPTTSEVEEVLTESSQAPAKDEDWSIPCRGQDTSVCQGQPRDDLDHSFTISRNSTLNLAQDSSIKSHLDALPLQHFLSPRTQEQVRTSIKALFPNGPPITPIRPLKRTKENAEGHIAGCTKSNKAREGGIKTPKSLKLFKGCSYGITAATNCVEEEQPETAKCARRGPHSANINTSAFNSRSDEIAKRLKLNERRETPREQPAFSPLPSTSTDNETIIKNDKHFLKSSDYYYHLDTDDDDDDLPEILWDNSSIKGKNNEGKNKITSNSIIQEDENYAVDVTVDVNEDMNKNDYDIIVIIDEDDSEIDFDKLMPKELLLDSSKNDPEVDTVSENRCPAPPLNVPTALRPVCPTTSSDVISVDDVYANSNTLNPFSTRPSSNPSTRPVLRTTNNNATSSETSQSDQVIEVPDEPINMSHRAPVSKPAAWDEDVQFVSELRPLSPSLSTSAMEALISLKRYLISFSESFERKYGTSVNRISKRAKVNANKDTGAIRNNENAAPLLNNKNETPATENTITVNQVQTSDNTILSPRSGGCSSSGKQLGECPICFENLNRGSIASTNCGHVFCLECIRKSLKTSGKRCPSCRKQLKGIGYHQVFL